MCVSPFCSFEASSRVARTGGISLPMRKLLRLLPLMAAMVLISPSAHAGENKHLGVIVVSGSSLNNMTTAAPFRIPPGEKITLYCTAAVQVLTDSTVVSTGTTGTKGVPVGATTLFPTSVGQAQGSISGTQTAVIAIIGTASCDVWLRLGTE